MLRSCLALLTAAAVTLPLTAEHGPAQGQHGAVASAEVNATQAGIDILKAGGNAVDAAVAVGFALAVTHSSAGNIGGGGFMLIRQADGQNFFVDFREEAPGKASPTMYQDAQGNIIKGRSTIGMLASGIPGTVAGLVSAQKKLGKLTLAQDMAPAIRLAEQGFALDTAEANGFRRSRNLGEFPDSHRVFQRDGDYYQAGDIFKQPELAHTLTLIAQGGADAFYKGPIAEQFAAFEAANGGLITRDDLAHYQAKWRQPLSVQYHGYDILTSPPPSSGGIAIVEMLNMLDNSGFVKDGMDSAAALHDEIEAERRAMADRAVYLGDPDFVKVPMDTLLSPAYAKERWSSVQGDRASLSKDVGAGAIPGFESDETTHFSVVDPGGDAVAVTYTLNFGYGSGVTAGHLGFLLNDEMDDFTSKPGAPNGFNLIQGKANDIEPYKRPLSSMVPTIVSKDGKLALVVGSPGGPRIITTVFEVLTDVLDFGLNVQQAVDAPRFHQQWMPEDVYLEGPGRFSPDTLALLTKMGYPLKVGGTWCDAEAIQIDAKTGMRLAATDPRADGAAIAY
ncbi:MAG TPA: gamma-glutamyltransferase [Terriglobales bacterium]|nr:gamma-glutamyltransferase [Terriglobales bacterium]